MTTITAARRTATSWCSSRTASSCWSASGPGPRAMTELQYLWQVTVAGLGTGLIYGIVGIGFAIVLNVSGVINLAQGEFSMLGAMLALYALQTLGLPMAAAVVLAVVLVTALGVVFERVCISRLKVFSLQAAIFIT